MRKTLLLISILLFCTHTPLPARGVVLKPPKEKTGLKSIVRSTQQIVLNDFPNSHNPSLIRYGDGFLMTFRYLPDMAKRPWVSYIGIVQLDMDLNIISKPELLDTCLDDFSTPSQSEDARIFQYRNDIYVIYNDNRKVKNPTIKERREMYISKLKYVNNHFVATKPVLMYHEKKYSTVLWQKNWVPFVWNDTLLLGYTVNPHEILSTDLVGGGCSMLYNSHPHLNWNWGKLRGGTPATLVDGEYLAFFHSGKSIKSIASNNEDMWHYFMGAYTFSAEPPFNLKRISGSPIVHKSFYTVSDRPKRVVYPGGYAVVDDKIYIAYGKDDCEVWIAVLDKERVLDSLQAVSNPIPIPK